MFEDELNYTDILWKGIPQLKKAVPYSGLQGFLYMWIVGVLLQTVLFLLYGWSGTIYGYVLYSLKLISISSLVVALLIILFSLRLFFYQYIITDKGVCIKKCKKMNCYAWNRIPSVRMRNYLLFSFTGQHLDIPVYPVTPQEKAWFKKQYPGMKNVQVKFEYIPDFNEPKKIIEQHIS